MDFHWNTVLNWMHNLFYNLHQIHNLLFTVTKSFAGWTLIWLATRVIHVAIRNSPQQPYTATAWHICSVRWIFREMADQASETGGHCFASCSIIQPHGVHIFEIWPVIISNCIHFLHLLTDPVQVSLIPSLSTSSQGWADLLDECLDAIIAELLAPGGQSHAPPLLYIFTSKWMFSLME